MRIARPSLLTVPKLSDWLFRFDSTVAGLAVVLRDRKSAAEPATCGEAMEVPDSVVVPPPSLVERMLEPGAQMSTQEPKLLKEDSALVLVVEATVAIPLFVPAPARAGEELQALAALLPAASA
jgi:hypothetical protein